MEDHKNVFRFFALPREMRDLMYDAFDSYKPRKVYPCLKTCNIKFNTSPVHALLFVSKQFKREYEERPKFSHVDAAIPLDMWRADLSRLQAPTPPDPTRLRRHNITVSLRLGFYAWKWDQSSEDVVHYVMSELCGLMPCLREMDIQCHINIEAFDEYAMSGQFNKAMFFTPDGTLYRFGIRTINISRSVLLFSWLCGGMRNLERTQEYGMDGAVSLRHYKQNEIAYVGRPSTGSYTWHGLKLEVVQRDKQLDVDKAFEDLDMRRQEGAAGNLGA